MKPLYLIFMTAVLLSTASKAAYAQEDEDALFIKEIHSYGLKNNLSYQWLEGLCKDVGGRLTGSENAEKAVRYMYELMQSLDYDTVYLQEVEVPVWSRGEKEVVEILRADNVAISLGGLALGNSVGTGDQGLRAEVVEVKNFEELERLGEEKVAGKIVFFNCPMDPTEINTFNAYGKAVGQRVYGASEAAKYGALGVLVRSIGTASDDFPHTGVMRYKENIPKIPAMAISTQDADFLSQVLSREKVQVKMRSTCQNLPPAISHNVIGEIRGSTFPEEIILTGGHLDAWDVGEGAHDDGAGCVHAIAAMQILKSLDYSPERTWRTVLFMNEENGLKGGLEYARVSNLEDEYHLAALESDAGGFSPRAFSFDADEGSKIPLLQKVYEWEGLFSPYGMQFIGRGSGADISPLKSQGGLLIGLRPDSQRYFDLHHSARDVFEEVNKRELTLGSTAIASLIYLLDKYGTD